MDSPLIDSTTKQKDGVLNLINTFSSKKCAYAHHAHTNSALNSQGHFISLKPFKFICKIGALLNHKLLAWVELCCPRGQFTHVFIFFGLSPGCWKTKQCDVNGKAAAEDKWKDKDSSCLHARWLGRAEGSLELGTLGSPPMLSMLSSMSWSSSSCSSANNSS